VKLVFLKTIPMFPPSGYLPRSLWPPIPDFTVLTTLWCINDEVPGCLNILFHSSSLIDPNRSLNILFSDTLNLYFSFSA
jgi:hypothetical protein